MTIDVTRVKELLDEILASVNGNILLPIPVIATLQTVLQKSFYRIWKRITLSTEDVRHLTEELRGQIICWDNDDEFAFNVCHSFSVPKEGSVVDTVLLRPRDLNFMEDVYEEDLLKRAQEFNLGLCPTGIILPLRKEFLEQECGRGHTISVLTEPFCCLSEQQGRPDLSSVSHGRFRLVHRSIEEGPKVLLGNDGGNTIKPDELIVLAVNS